MSTSANHTRTEVIKGVVLNQATLVKPGHSNFVIRVKDSEQSPTRYVVVNAHDELGDRIVDSLDIGADIIVIAQITPTESASTAGVQEVNATELARPWESRRAPAETTNSGEPMTTPNPILEAFRTDPEQHESWIVREYLNAIEEYRDRPESEFDEDSNLRLLTYFRVSRCGATPEQVDEAYAHLLNVEDQLRTR